MSNSARNTLTILMLFVMAAAAFTAGYLTNSLVTARRGATLAEENGELTLFWEAWGRVEAYYIGQLPDMQRVTYGAIRGALSEIGDPYTIFIEPVAREEERQSLSGVFGGIGATLSRNEAGELRLDIIPGNPAEAAGVQNGDILLAVNDTPILADMTVEAVAQLIRGEVGTQVTLTLIHPDQSEPTTITVTRAEILIPSVNYRLLEQDPTIGYIQLTRFSGESSGEIEQAISALQGQGAEKLILDLRQNGGGLLDAAIQVADHFLADGVIMYQQSQGEDERVYEANSDNVAGEMALVILIDGGTASSSEIVAGALHDRGRAALIGNRSYGKGSVQLVFDLSDGSSVHVTSARWFTPNRHQIDQQGLEPDIPVEITQEAIDTGRDDTLLRAIAYLQNGN